LPFVYIFFLMLISRWAKEWQWILYGSRILLVGIFFATLLFSRYVHFKDSHPAPFLNNLRQAINSEQGYWSGVARLIRNPDAFEENPDGLGVFNIRYNLIASVGDFVRMNYRDDVVVVYDQIGQAPWYAGKKTFFIDNLGLGYREIGLAKFHKSAQDSFLYSTYEDVMAFLVEWFWPEEQRVYSEQEVISRLLEKKPDVIIARKAYVKKDRNNILTVLLRDPEILKQYHAHYLLNNREIIFERISRPEDFRLLANDAYIVPPGAKVQRITGFHWCDNSPCMELAKENVIPEDARN